MRALRRPMRAWRLAMVMGALAGPLSCGDGERAERVAEGPSPSPQPAEARAVPVPPEHPSPPTVPPQPPPSRARPVAAPGVAYFAVRGKGIRALTEDGFTAVPGSEGIAARQLALGPAGALYSLGSGGVGRVEGDTWVLKFPATATQAAPWTQLAVAADGTPWVLGPSSVARGEGKTWRVQTPPALATEVTLRDIALDAEGRPWVSATDGLRYRDDRGWHLARDGAFSSLATDAAGDGILAFGQRPVRVRGPAAIAELPWAGVEPGGAVRASWGAHSAAVWVAPDTNHLQWRDDFGDGRYTGQDVLPGHVDALRIDASARVWVATDAGVCVLSAERNVRWPLGSVSDLAGPIDDLVVAGGGPAALPAAGSIETGTLEGTVLLDGKPLTHAPVELCPRPGTRVKKTPCEASPLRRALVTDDTGRFVAADVPLGAYGVGVMVAGAWKITFGGAYGGAMKPGERHDIGSLDFRASPERAD